MNPDVNGTLRRGQKANRIQGEGPNWVFIVGGALLSTLVIRVGCRLRQVLVRRKSDNTHENSAGNGRIGARDRSGARTPHRNVDVGQNGSGCFTPPGSVEIKRASSRSTMELEPSLPLVMIPTAVPSRENNLWRSSPERLELPQRPFHHSNSSESLRLSESASDVSTKRDVVHKLCQQLKRRDDMILEMQTQLRELQNAVSLQTTQSAHLQSQLDSANKDLFESEREIQRLRMVIADQSLGEMSSPRKPASSPGWHPQTNGHSNGYLDNVTALDLHCVNMEKGSRNGERIEMLKKEVQELKEVLEGKEFLLQSYKEQKTELTTKVKELQQRINYQAPNIL